MMETARRSPAFDTPVTLTSSGSFAVPLADRAGAPLTAGVGRVARLAGNVGYLALSDFHDSARFAVIVDEVMDGLSDADALIIDLRGHRGGSRSAAALLASCLFHTEPLHVDAVYWGPDSSARPLRIVPRGMCARYAEKRVIVLTGAATSAVAAELARSLQALGRATVIGEAPVRGGAGDAAGAPPLVPDLTAPAAQALRVAHLLALRELLAK